MRLFTMAHHQGLHCDAYLIDSDRSARPLVVTTAGPLEPVVDAILDRVVLMSRSLHAVRERTFGLFFAVRGHDFVIAPAYPFYASIYSSLRDVLEGFGKVRRAPDERLGDDALEPLLAFEDGIVSFIVGPTTRPWVKLASRRGLAIVAGVWTHAVTNDVLVDGVPAIEYLAAPEEVTIDLDITDELPQEELERLLREHRRQT
jgi:hypothetical protein